MRNGREGEGRREVSDMVVGIKIVESVRGGAR